MAKTIKLEVVTPEKRFYSGDVEMVIVRTALGEEGFMAGHAWACKLLDVGELRIKEPGSEAVRIAAIAGGYIDVKDSVMIYTDSAEWPNEIDKKRLAQKRAEVEAFLENKKGKNPGLIAEYERSLKKAVNRKNVLEGGIRKK